MVKKIVNITLSQIIMWVIACLNYALQCRYFDNKFVQYLCIIIVPIVLMVGYALIWFCKYSDNNGRLIKRMFQNCVLLLIWLSETYVFLLLVVKLIDSGKWAIYDEGWIKGILFFYWAIFAAGISIIAVIMLLLANLIKSFRIKKIIYKVINTLFVAGIIILILLDMSSYESWMYIAGIVCAVLTTFLFNFCYLKTQ